MISLRKNSPQPLYLQLRESLRREIAAGRFRADQPIPCERTLAARLGLNRLTVRRAIMDLTREGLLERIRGRGTYVKNVARASDPATDTDTPRALTLGVVASFDRVDPQDSLFYYRILQGAHRACDSSISIVYRKVEGSVVEFTRRLAQQADLDGAIAVNIVDEELLAALGSLAIPHVLLDCVPQVQPVGDVIAYRTQESAARAVTSLLEMGHRDIGMLIHANVPMDGPVQGGLDAQTRERITALAMERLNGYEQAFRSQGLAVPDELIYPVLPCTRAGYSAVRHILRGTRVPTALFASTDELALGAIAAVKDHGWRVPDDLSVIGFGDLGHFCTPALSCVRMPLESVGETAVQLLRERIANPDLPLRTMNVETEYISRASCDIPRAATCAPAGD